MKMSPIQAYIFLQIEVKLCIFSVKFVINGNFLVRIWAKYVSVFRFNGTLLMQKHFKFEFHIEFNLFCDPKYHFTWFFLDLGTKNNMNWHIFVKNRKKGCFFKYEPSLLILFKLMNSILIKDRSNLIKKIWLKIFCAHAYYCV